MNDVESEATASKSPVKSSAWSWVWPIVVVLLALAKVLGLVSSLVALSAYFWLKPRIGIWRAAAASSVLAVVAGVGIVTLLNSV